MGRFPKPCLVCGALTQGLSYCTTHQEQKDNLNALRLQEYKKRKPNIYDYDYRKRAKVVRETAIICHLCSEPARFNDPFEADHLLAGDKSSPLAAAHRSCNQKRGNNPL
jgi:hypothetical protein